MSEFPELLDDEELRLGQKEYIPAVVMVELWLFPIVNILTYVLVLSMYGIIFGFLLHFAVGVWQIFSFLACWQVKNNPHRNLYKKLLLGYIVTGALGFILFSLTEPSNTHYIFLVLWLFIFPHALNWLYWVAVRYDARRLKPAN